MRFAARKALLLSKFGSALVLVAAGMPLPTRAAETQVTSANIPDYEFDHLNNQMAWGDRAGNIWIANVDPDTGLFIPSNGQGVLADTGAVYVLDCGNGPEWTYSANGNFITYTKYVDPNGPKTMANFGIGIAKQINGEWQGGLMPGGAGYQEPLGTLNPDDTNPKIFYKVTTGGWQMYASPVNRNPAQGTPIPGSELSKGSERWVPGKNQVIFTEEFIDTDGQQERQVFLWDGDTDVTTQLTFDNGRKDAAFMWQAPEFNNAYVFFAAVNSETIQFYRPASTSRPLDQTTWQAFAAAPIPPGAPKYVNSPEPFVYQGHSYVFYLRSESSDSTDTSAPTQTWLSAMNGSINKEISDPTEHNVVRVDPEYFITSQGPYIYYNRFTPAAPGVPVKSQGIWRSSTGLGPQSGEP